MPERRGRERIFEIDPVKRPKGRFLRILIAKYVGWVEAFGYVFCAAVASGIITCWVYRVDEVAKEKEVGKSLVKPREESLTHVKDAVVTAVLVKDFQHVAHAEALVEICDDPAWVLRSRAIQRLDEFAKKVRELEKEGPLPQALLAQAAAAEKEVDAWTKGEAKKGTRTVLRAPFEGDVSGLQDIEGKFFKAGDPICKVVDFTDLRLPIKLSGTNVERVRVGMPAKIKIIPEQYGLGCVLKADARLGWFRSERLLFNYALDGKDIKTLLMNWWKTRPVVADEDARRGVALTPTEIEEVEVTCSLQAEPIPGSEVQKIPESAFIEVDHLAAQNPLRGTVVEGKHTGTYTTNFLAPEVCAELNQRINQQLKDKIARVPGSKPTSPLRLLEASNVRNFLKLKASVSDLSLEDVPTKPAVFKPGEQKPPAEINMAIADQKATADAEWKARRAGMDERLALAAASGVDVDKGDRFFEGVVRINTPPPLLSQKVKEAYARSPSSFLKAKVEVVVGQCRLAMLLFRQ